MPCWVQGGPDFPKWRPDKRVRATASRAKFTKFPQIFSGCGLRSERHVRESVQLHGPQRLRIPENAALSKDA